MLRIEKSEETKESWHIVGATGSSPAAFLAEVLMHLPKDAEAYYIPGVVTDLRNEVDIIVAKPNMHTEPGKIYLRRIYEDTSFDGRRFVKYSPEEMDIEGLMSCAIRENDIKILAGFLAQPNESNDEQVYFCRYAGDKRLSANEINVKVLLDDERKIIVSRIVEVVGKNLKNEAEEERLRFDVLKEITDEIIFEYKVDKAGKLHNLKVDTGFSTDVENAKSHFDIMMIHRDDKKVFRGSLRSLAMGETDKESFDVRIKSEDGKYLWHHIIAKSTKDRDGKVKSVIGTVKDINSVKLESIRLKKEATVDPLTKVLNKQTFRDTVKAKLSEADVTGRHAMLILDIDNFKKINDNLGHLYGDSVLVSTAEALSSQVKSGDVIGRFGGDEFFIFLFNYRNDTNIKRKVQEIRDEFLDHMVPITMGSKPITCSIGVVIIDGKKRRFEEIFERADRALYQVKENGKNSIGYYTNDTHEAFLSDNKRKFYRDEIEESEKNYEDVISFALELLEEAKDAEGAVKLLCGRVGKFFGLKNIFIFEKKPENNGKNWFFKWPESAEADVSEGDCVRIKRINARLIEDYEKALQQLDRDRLTYKSIGDTDTKSELFVEFLKAFDLEDMLVTPICYSDTVSGCIAYCGDKNLMVENHEAQMMLMKISRILRGNLEKFYAYQRANDKDKYAATYDKITHLFNEDVFKQKLDELIPQINGRRQYALLTFDICEFRFFNDVYGFNAGDKLLRSVAYGINRVRDPYIVMAARAYADNFHVLINSSDDDIIKETYDAICEEITQVMNMYPEFPGEIAAGVCLVENRAFTAADLIENAIMAKKVCKKKTRNGLCTYSLDIKSREMRDMATLGLIDEAIDDDEFEIYLQPKIDIATGKLVGAEALTRWIKATGDVAPPSTFIPLLEEKGKIVKLDFYMFEKLIRKMSVWLREGLEIVPISANFSRHHIRNPRFVERIKKLAEMYAVPTKYIEIEITEDAFVEDEKSLINVMNRLKEEGFVLSLDDFGKGYSSLNMLNLLPMDVIKLDKEFLSSFDNEISRRLLVNVIKLINDSCKHVICEGVETEEQAQFLLKSGCNLAQGYLYSRPIPEEEFKEKFLQPKEIQ